MKEEFYTELREYLLNNGNCSSDEMESLLEVAYKFKGDEE